MNIADRDIMIAEMNSCEHYAFFEDLNIMKQQLLSNLYIIFLGQVSLVKGTAPWKISSKICAFLHGMSVKLCRCWRLGPGGLPFFGSETHLG